MSKTLFLTVLGSLCLMLTAFAQTQTNKEASVVSSNTLPDDEISAYRKQAVQMVSFMEFAFNTIGSSKTEYKEKDIIISQSYTKFFRDAKVQIEDDLAEQRDVVTNKDVQAYLKDIDFFFTDVAFRFTVEEVTQEVNEKGETFFKVRASRNLKGKTIEGKEIENNKLRFIEINLDETRQELKIVSIYTTRSGEEEEVISWWNSLEPEWRAYFASNTVVYDSIPLFTITSVKKDTIFVQQAGLSAADTVNHAIPLAVNTAAVFSEIRRFLRTDKVDISGNKKIYDLDPLSALRLLKVLNISNSGVTELNPVRNLPVLETLILKGSLVSSLLPLQYSTSLVNLDLSETFVSDLSQLPNFRKLEFLDISKTQAADFAPVTALSTLRELKMNRSSIRSIEGIEALEKLSVLDLSESVISDLTPAGGLKNLQKINFEHTTVSDISPLAGVPSLQYIYMDFTRVNDLLPLQGLKDLKFVYCDKSGVTRDIALKFNKVRPDVKVIYESEELAAWWQGLSPDWKAVFNKLSQLDATPRKEQLHELTGLKNIDISGNKSIVSLAPLTKLPSLEFLDASSTGISGIEPLAESVNLRELDISDTPVTALSSLSALTTLQVLDISGTGITDLLPIATLRNLQQLSLNKCPVTSVKPLLSLKRLELLHASGVPVVEGAIGQLWDSIPDALVVYRTDRLLQWWNALPENWKQVFISLVPVNGEPESLWLHRIASLRELDLSNTQGISDLTPLGKLLRLEKLNISRLPVSSLLPIASFTRLKEFNCSNTPVEDLSPLAFNRNLSALYLSNTPINNLDVLKSFPDLKILDISGTQVTRLNALETASKLEQLDCYNTRLSSLKALDVMPSLKLLRVYNTRLSQKGVDKFKAANPGVEVVFY